MPLCRTPAERLFVQQFILDRTVLIRPRIEPKDPEKLIIDCLERLKHEGNEHLLRIEGHPAILEELQGRQHEIKLLEQSRLRRVIYRIRQRSRMAKLIYPSSRMRRVDYQIGHLFEEIRNKTSRFLRSR